MVNKEKKPVEARVDEVMQIEGFGCLQKLLRVTAKVLRFIRIVRSKVSGTVQEVTVNDDVDDLKAAEVLWVQATQRCSFPEEVKLLSEFGNDVQTNLKSKVKQFGLYFDGEGVMRSRGRVNASSLPPNSKNPIRSAKQASVCRIVNPPYPQSNNAQRCSGHLDYIKRAILDLTRARNYQENHQTLRCLS
jgi:hypothetical protein